MNRPRFVIIVLSLSALAGCHTFPSNPPVEMDGHLYGVIDGPFKHRWWNYYERGFSFTEGKIWDRAEIDFREAIRQYGEDRRNVPTYGRHLTDYFPRRELGIVLFHQGRWDEAVRELEASLSTEKSAKAEFYLNKARKAMVEIMGLDKRPPALSVTSPGRGATSKGFTLTVSGEATDDTYIASILVNDQSVGTDLSAAHMPFKVEIPLRIGRNPIRIKVLDIAGKISIWEKIVHCDRTGPVVSLSLVENRMRGYALDDSAIRSLSINGRPVAFDPGPETTIDYPLPKDAPSRLSVEAEDVAGNRTVAIVNTKKDRPRGIAPPGLPVSQQQEWRTRLGRYHALVIGIDDYSNGWDDLETARADAEAVAEILKTKYGFAEDDVRLLLDGEATWQRIISEMRSLARCLEESDNLLVYFAGHGYLDRPTRDGYWIPADGSRGKPSTYITNSAVRAIFSPPHTRIKNLLIIADSCYSGSLLLAERNRPPRMEEQSTPFPADRYSLSMKSRGDQGRTRPESRTPILIAGFRPSRQVMASGGLVQVSDVGKGRHSLFGTYLLEALRANEQDYIDVEHLFHARLWPVLDTQNQRPELGRLDCGGDQDGQFIFQKKSAPDVRTIPPCPREANPPVSEPPKIQITSPGDGHVTYPEELVVDFTLDTPNGAQWITVNGEAVLTRPGRWKLSGSHTLKLTPGKNRIVVRCADQIGTIGEKTLTVVRKIPLVFRPEHRMPLLWNSFIDHDTNAGNLVRQQLGRMDRFRIFLSGIGNQSHLDEEPHFQVTGQATPGRDSLTITMEVIDGEDGAILKTLDVYTEFAEDREEPLMREIIKKKSKELALKVVDAFPRVRGKIESIKAGEITVDRGASDRIFVGLWAIFYNGMAEDLHVLNEGRITILEKDKAKIPTTHGTGHQKLIPGMGFIIK